MQLLKALWALAGAALCCFLVLVIHAQFLKEGNCPPARQASSTFGRRRCARPGQPGTTAGAPAPGAHPARPRAVPAAALSPGSEAAGAGASVRLVPPGPGPLRGCRAVPFPARLVGSGARPLSAGSR